MRIYFKIILTSVFIYSFNFHVFASSDEFPLFQQDEKKSVILKEFIPTEAPVLKEESTLTEVPVLKEELTLKEMPIIEEINSTNYQHNVTCEECKYLKEAISVKNESELNELKDINNKLNELIKINSQILEQLKQQKNNKEPLQAKKVNVVTPPKATITKVNNKNKNQNQKATQSKIIEKQIPFSKFTINSLYKDQVWLNVDNKVYVAEIGDNIGGVIIQNINLDKGIVKTSKGELKK